MDIIKGALLTQKFYSNIAGFSLNERQLKALGKMVDKLPEEFAGGLTNKKYTTITKVSPATVKRDIKELVDLGILISGEEKGRSTSYQINPSFLD